MNRIYHPKYMVSSSDLDALTRVVYGEARGESNEGKKAAAFTVINRSQKSGKSIATEAKKPSQFCCYSGEMKDTISKNRCEEIANSCINGTCSDPTSEQPFSILEAQFLHGRKAKIHEIGRASCRERVSSPV